MATTPNLSLNKPAFGAAGWDVTLNDNFDKIDADSLTVDTAGEGYFYGIAIQPAATAGSVVATAIDRIVLAQFVLPFRATFNRMVIRVTTGGGAGKKVGAALLDKDLNVIAQTGALDANATGAVSATAALTTVEPGIYWIAQTSDSITTQCVVVQTGLAFSLMADVGTRKSGRSVDTASSPGVFSSPVAAPSLVQGFNPILVLFTRE